MNSDTFLVESLKTLAATLDAQHDPKAADLVRQAVAVMERLTIENAKLRDEQPPCKS